MCVRLQIDVGFGVSCPLALLLGFVGLGGASTRALVSELPLWDILQVGHQQDVQEAVRLLLDHEGTAHSHCDAATCLAKRFQSIFLVHEQNALLCTEPHCNYSGRPCGQPALDVSIFVRAGSLEVLLNEYQSEEILADLSDFVCTTCSGLVQKRLQVLPQGDVLMMHLKRFQHRGSHMRKLHDKVTFPQQFQFNGQRYNFVAVITHIGQSARGGHYISVVDTDALYKCNDTAVDRCDWVHASQQQPYMLLYCLLYTSDAADE